MNMRIIQILILCTFLIATQGKAQDVDNLEKHSVSINILGSSALAGITYESILSNRIIFEFGVGIAGVGAGLTFYPFKIKESNFCPYTGVKFSSVVLLDVGGGYGGYIPIGVTLFSINHFNIGFDFGPAIGKWRDLERLDFEDNSNIVNDNTKNIYVYGNVKIGRRY